MCAGEGDRQRGELVLTGDWRHQQHGDKVTAICKVFFDYTFYVSIR